MSYDCIENQGLSLIIYTDQKHNDNPNPMTLKLTFIFKTYGCKKIRYVCRIKYKLKLYNLQLGIVLTTFRS